MVTQTGAALVGCHCRCWTLGFVWGFGMLEDANTGYGGNKGLTGGIGGSKEHCAPRLPELQQYLFVPTNAGLLD